MPQFHAIPGNTGKSKNHDLPENQQSYFEKHILQLFLRLRRTRRAINSITFRNFWNSFWPDS